MTQAKVQPKRGEAPSSLSEVATRLEAIEQKLDQVLTALTAAANETVAVHTERVDLVRRVASLERWRAEMEDRMTQQQGA